MERGNPAANSHFILKFAEPRSHPKRSAKTAERVAQVAPFSASVSPEVTPDPAAGGRKGQMEGFANRCSMSRTR